MQRSLLKWSTAVLLSVHAIAFAQFSGDLRLAPKGCEETGQCKLQAPLRYKDAAGTVWEAMAGLVTDGASIPGIFQPFIGDPFDEKFIKAAIVHDHYCDRHVRSWTESGQNWGLNLIRRPPPVPPYRTSSSSRRWQRAVASSGAALTPP